MEQCIVWHITDTASYQPWEGSRSSEVYGNSTKLPVTN